MTPPLVGKFMCGYKPGQVDVFRSRKPADETDLFRVGNRVGKRLGKGAVAGKLDDAVLVELIWSVVVCVVIQARLGRLHHLVYIVGVGGQVIDLQFHAVPGVAFHRVFTGDVTEEILDACRTHAVVEVSASVLFFFSLPQSWLREIGIEWYR